MHFTEKFFKILFFDYVQYLSNILNDFLDQTFLRKPLDPSKKHLNCQLSKL